MPFFNFILDLFIIFETCAHSAQTLRKKMISGMRRMNGLKRQVYRSNQLKQTSVSRDYIVFYYIVNYSGSETIACICK